MIRLVLFDIDGTLIYTSGAGEKAFARVFATQFGIPNGTANLQFAGRTDPSIVRDFFVQHGLEASAENFSRFFEPYVFWLDHFLRDLPGGTHPGVREWIRELQALPSAPALGLLTGNIRLGAEIKLRRFGLWDAFVTGGFGDDSFDRNAVAAVARKRGDELLGKLEGDEILVVGDTPLDILCARSIGARVLAVATGGCQLGRLQEQAPDWAVPDLTQLSPGEICGCGTVDRQELDRPAPGGTLWMDERKS